MPAKFDIGTTTDSKAKRTSQRPAPVSNSSVVVSKFAAFRYRSPSELRNQNDTRNQYVASVLSIPKFAKRRSRGVANFGIGTLGRPVLVSNIREHWPARPGLWSMRNR